ETSTEEYVRFGFAGSGRLLRGLSIWGRLFDCTQLQGCVNRVTFALQICWRILDSEISVMVSRPRRTIRLRAARRRVPRLRANRICGRWRDRVRLRRGKGPSPGTRAGDPPSGPPERSAARHLKQLQLSLFPRFPSGEFDTPFRSSLYWNV